MQHVGQGVELGLLVGGGEHYGFHARIVSGFGALGHVLKYAAVGGRCTELRGGF